MSEIVFLIEEDPDGGYSARALGESIFTQGDDLESLRANIRDSLPQWGRHIQARRDHRSTREHG